jgi:hypothetical protein
MLLVPVDEVEVRPAARTSASIMRAVLVLPLVPVRWITG